MKVRLFTLISLFVVLSLAAVGILSAAQGRPTAPATPAPAPDRARVAAALHSAPLTFIQNAGQFADGARFQVRGGGGMLWLAEDGLWVTVMERPRTDLRGLGDLGGLRHEDQPHNGVNLKLSFVGANPHPRLEPFNRLDTHASYFIGNDPAKWRADVPVWGGVRYTDLYPGIDLELSSAGGTWQPSLVAHSGADLSAVRLRVEGADEVALEGDHVRLSTAAGPVSLPPLLTGDGAPLTPTMMDGTVTFHQYPLNPFPESVHSPSDSPTDLIYSTFLGGSDSDQGNSIAVDTNGAVYTTGVTGSLDFPTTAGAFQTTHGGYWDAFVAKLNATGSALLYSTFLGGSNDECFWRSCAITVDASGAAYVTGDTASSDFPINAGAFQTTYGGGRDAFLTKLNAAGSELLYSTFLGGSDSDQSNGVAVDASGAAYITGQTASPNFPTTPGAFQTTYGGGSLDSFVAKLNETGSALLYSTFLGGSDYEPGRSIAVDAGGSAYVTGFTYSSDFPTTSGAFQTTFGGYTDAFVTKLNAAGSGLVYSTFLGGSSDECAFGGCAIAVDAGTSAYVTGYTYSSDFPTTPGAFQTAPAGGEDAFVTKLNAAGSALLYSTFLGGNAYDEGYGIAVDVSGAAYVTGVTWSPDFPITPGAFQTTHGGLSDAFVTKLSVAGSALIYSTFLGGNNYDHGYSIAADVSGTAYIAGVTQSSDFPTTPGAFQTTWGGGICGSYPCSDAFVTRLVVVETPYRLYLPLLLNNP